MKEMEKKAYLEFGGDGLDEITLTVEQMQGMVFVRWRYRTSCMKKVIGKS